MNEGFMRGILRLVGGLISPFIFLFGFIANFFSLFPRFEVPITIILLVSAACIVAYTIWHIVESSKTRDLRSKVNFLEQKVDFLEQEVCKGLKMITNEVDITMNMSLRKYHLEFRKEYDVISEKSKYYSGQFYCNIILNSAEEALDYYEKNKVEWEDLNVRAYIQYKNPEDTEWSKQLEVYAKHVADGNNYKEFHIEYKTLPNKGMLNINKGSRVKIMYTYDVPLNIWGTYLNRYMTYWQEETKVTILCTDENKLLDDRTFELYELNKSGDPVLVQSEKWSDPIRMGDSFGRTITIPTKKNCCRYTVWWNAKVFFGDSVKNTIITADELQLTDR
jgi:hypothetical protein